MSNYANWAKLSQRQKMMMALGGNAHPTLGLEVRDTRTGAQLAIQPLAGIGADATVRSGFIDSIESSGLTTRVRESTLTATRTAYSPVAVQETAAPIPEASVRSVPTASSFTAVRQPTSVYSTDPAPAVQTTDTSSGYTFATGREGGAPDGFFTSDPASQNAYAEPFRESANDASDESSIVRRVSDETRGEIFQTVTTQVRQTGSTGGAAGFLSTLSPMQKLIGGAAVLFVAFKLFKD